MKFTPRIRRSKRFCRVRFSFLSLGAANYYYNYLSAGILLRTLNLIIAIRRLRLRLSREIVAIVRKTISSRRTIRRVGKSSGITGVLTVYIWTD